MKLKILGAEWNVEYRSVDVDSMLKENDGYTDPSVKLIVIANKKEDCEIQNFKCMQKENLRHEIIHAFCLKVGWDSISNIVNMVTKKL